MLLICGGLLLASGRYLFSRDGTAPRYDRYRHDLGRAILVGLEVLVAADIVRTVAFTPTMDSIVVLAMIVAIRTSSAGASRSSSTAAGPGNGRRRPPDSLF